MRTLIKNGKVLLSEKEGFKIAEGDIVVEDKFISKVVLGGEKNKISEAAEFDKVIDVSHSLVMPGLINAHTHAYMSLFRNYADDLEFFDWLHSVEVVEDKMTAEDCYWTTLLSVVEMIRTGTTCFVDMCMRSSIEGVKTGQKGAVSGAVNDSGMRAFLGRGLVGEADEEGAKRRINEFMADVKLNSDSDRTKFILGPHAPYSCPQSLLEKICEIGKKKNMMATIHISESKAEMKEIASKYGGITPVQYVANTGLFDLPVIAAHLVNATDDDIEILKEKNVSIAINPRSNMKLGNGFAPVKKFLDAGINICLGTDGSGSNNTQNMFQEMQFASLIYKGSERKARCVDVQDVLRFATLGGAEALNMEGKIGVIKEGALADMIIIDLEVPEFVPQNDLVSALCYSANGSEVKTVMINGGVVMEDKKILTFDEEEVYEKCNEIAKRLEMVKN